MASQITDLLHKSKAAPIISNRLAAKKFIWILRSLLSESKKSFEVEFAFGSFGVLYCLDLIGIGDPKNFHFAARWHFYCCFQKLVFESK